MSKHDAFQFLLIGIAGCSR